jgi:hypothetical protein
MDLLQFFKADDVAAIFSVLEEFGSSTVTLNAAAVRMRSPDSIGVVNCTDY